MKSLYPPDDLPSFYIVAPRYVRTSAGIRVMHLLCHWLNRLGYRAYLHIDPPWHGEAISPELTTPILTQSVIDIDYSRQITPIVILSEIVHDNPLRGGLVARFFGNYPGLLGGPTQFSSEEKLIAYSDKIAEALSVAFATLYVPAIDTRIFQPPQTPTSRNGSCAYLGKYKDVHGGSPFGLPNETEIFGRDEMADLTPSEIRALFYRKEYFYAFEDTALLTEAAMCGCVPVLMLNPHFTIPLGVSELKFTGYAVGASEDELKRARNTLYQVPEIYAERIDEFPDELKRVAELLIIEAFKKTYNVKVSLPLKPRVLLTYNGRVVTMAEVVKYIKLRGIGPLIKGILNFKRFRMP
jgi:hypothetical protein